MRFEYTYIYGAICPERDTGEAIVIDQVSKEAMQIHLEAVSACVPQNRHAFNGHGQSTLAQVLEGSRQHNHYSPPFL